MKLNPEQLERFDREGYLFFPSLFTPQEIAVLTAEVPRLYAEHRPENVREKGGEAVRTNFAAHLYSYPFAKLARHPRMVKPVMQILGEALYMHQYIAHRDFAPIHCLPDDCLLGDYDVPLPWKDGTPQSALKGEVAA